MPKSAGGHPLGRLGKAFAACGLVALAALAVLSGTDRISHEDPSTPNNFVGWPYDSGAARSRAIAAFIRTGPASAIGYASRAILSDPISIQTISMLGRANLYAGHAAEARRAFDVTAQLGWRDAMTQVYWLDQAVQAGDFKVAAERLDALLRQWPEDQNRDRFLEVLSATPEGRAALAERLKLSPVWADAFVMDLQDLPDEGLQERVDIVLRSGRGTWSCDQAATLTQRLINVELLDEAQGIWRFACPGPNALVYDGGFDTLDTTRATKGFNWLVSARGDVSSAISRDSGGNRRLDIEVTAPRTVIALSQLVVLKPGRFRLAWRTPDTSAASAHNISVSLSCEADLTRSVQGQPDPSRPGLWFADFMVDDACPTHSLDFWMAPNSQTLLDDVSLTAL